MITTRKKIEKRIHERIINYDIHPSVRGVFGYQLYKMMATNENIVLLFGDLGYKLFDNHRQDFPGRTYNCGASEQAMMDVAVGLALSGKKPIVYSITPFVVYRPFETLVQYISREKLPVKIIGSGIGNDYLDDGPSHWFMEYDSVPIMTYTFNTIQEMKQIKVFNKLLRDDNPYLILLRR